MLHADRLGVPEPDQQNLPDVITDLARLLFDTDPENVYYGRNFDDPHPRNSVQADHREYAILHAIALRDADNRSAPLACIRTREGIDEQHPEGRSGVR